MLGARPGPGVVITWSIGEPLTLSVSARRGTLAVGRGAEGFASLADERLSREHATLRRGQEDGEWSVEDLQSRNGTFLNGEPVRGEVSFRAPAVVRAGRTVALVVDDLPAPFDEPSLAGGVGPAFRHCLARAEEAGRTSPTLLVHGESGVGKELAATAFRLGAGHATAPFVAVNCATIPEGLAERVLFGAVRGAYSGATTDSGGYLQAADGGTLFFDEIGELDLDVQAKLLRVLETGELFPLGSARASRVKVKFVFATHRDLPRRVTEGSFRADLYYRIGGVRLSIPPLRERPVDVPWLIDVAVRGVAPSLRAHPQLVEACLLRPWPGNVRELLNALRLAATAAVGLGEASVTRSHLDPQAGLAWTAPPAEATEGPAPAPEPPSPVTRQGIEQALAAHPGNLAAAARALGINRTTLYRRLRELGLDPERRGGP